MTVLSGSVLYLVKYLYSTVAPTEGTAAQTKVFMH